MRSKVEEKWFWNCNIVISKYSRKYHFGVTKNGLGLVRAQMCASALTEHAVARPEHAMARPECALKVFDRSTITNITNDSS